MCTGTNVSLTARGSPPPPGIMTWTVEGTTTHAVFNTVQSTFAHTFDVAGTFTVKAEWECESFNHEKGHDTAKVTVADPSVAIAGPPRVVCANVPATFTATGTPPGGSYSWTGGPSAPSFTTTFTIVGPATASVTYTCPSGSTHSASSTRSLDVLATTQTTPGIQAVRFPGGPTLTDAEWALVQAHPIAAIGMNFARGDAEQEAITRFGTVPDGTKANAFLHAAWNYIAAQSALVGSTLAKQFTDAHEDFFGNPCANLTTGASKFMDLNNNQVGLDIATDPATAGLPQSQGLDILENMASTGQLTTITGGC